MRAKQVNEVEEFKQGGDPYHKMKIGRNFLPFKEEDKIEILVYLYWRAKGNGENSSWLEEKDLNTY